GLPLASFRRYYWRVGWGDARGRISPLSRTASFGTGALSARDWTARWIEPRSLRLFKTKGTTLLGRDLGDVIQARGVYLRKEFRAPRDAVRAAVFICGLGHYELRLNGRKVGDHVLDPGWTDYARRALYAAYDVTGRLASRNAFGVVLGNGRHIPTYGYGGPRLFLELVIERRDGSELRVVSDGSWMSGRGPILENGLYDGEVCDARLEARGWDKPGFAARSWAPVKETGGPALVAQTMPAVRVVRTIRPRRALTTAPGVRIFDFGQNLAGWVRIAVRGPRGAEVRLRHAEILHEDGSLNTSPNQNAAATDVYRLEGRGIETYEPRFSYHGFRYAEIRTGPSRVRLLRAEARAVRSAVETAGRFRSSHPLINRVQANILRGQASNLMSIPTDCPQRDERHGWLGDAHLAAEQACFNFDLAAFWAKFVEDIRLSQRKDGSLPDVVPPYYKQLYPSDPAWGTAYPQLVWLLYWRYGDDRALAAHYASVKRYVDFLWSRSRGGLLKNLGKYGDWCPPGSIGPKKTPLALTSTFYLYHDTGLFVRMAETLGQTSVARRYAARRETIGAAFNGAFLRDGEYAGRRFGPADRAPSQTSQILPLALGLVPSRARRSVIGALMRSVVDDRDFHLDTGIIGTRYLLEVLTAIGRGDAAFRVATQTSYPGWGYMIREGATTLWERWEKMTGGGMNSHNHIMLGSVGAWFYGALAGIRCLAPGWARMAVQPLVPAGLRSVRAAHRTVRGVVKAGWARDDGLFRLSVEIPVGVAADIVLPMASPSAEVRADDRLVWKQGRAVPHPDVEFVRDRRREGALVLRVGSGRYDFAVS
ncbi:MAG: family 78 glycoside hydrolase catalytic domain, partial [Candidatus Aminicenantes bacterium]|nr:family 78 glycoside hydrolase catalytic domain [Candidatus Aminicenantes bacterium]